MINEIPGKSEDFSRRLSIVSRLREQPGQNTDTLGLIRGLREEARRLGLHGYVVDLYWEECLMAKHMFNDNPQDSSAVSIFKTAAIAADGYIEKFNVGSKRIRSGRFVGEAAMLEGDYEEAISVLRRTVLQFETDVNPEQRVNALELRGFLSEAFIRSGKAQKGIKTGIKTFEDFNKGLGLSLKKRDYYVWAVWKSGIVIKMWNAILDMGVELDESERKELLDELDEAEKLFNVPHKEEYLSHFEIRKAQIFKVREKINT